MPRFAFQRGKKPHRANKQKRKKASRRQKSKVARYLRNADKPTEPTNTEAPSTDHVVADGLFGDVLPEQPIDYYAESPGGIPEYLGTTTGRARVFGASVREIRVALNTWPSGADMADIRLTASTGYGTQLTIHGSAVGAGASGTFTVASELASSLGTYLDNTTTGSSMVNSASNLWNTWCEGARRQSGWRQTTNDCTDCGSTTGVYFIPTSITEEATAAWTASDWIYPTHLNVNWNQPRGIPRQETEEQRIAREEREVRARAEREERLRVQRLRDAERRRIREEAAERARRLLLMLLTPEQRAELEEKKHFHLTVMDRDGSERVYRIEQGFQGNVKLLGPDGEPIRRYCIHSNSQLPHEDQMLAQKLLLETDEADFHRIANESVIRRAGGPNGNQFEQALGEALATLQRGQRRASGW